MNDTHRAELITEFVEYYDRKLTPLAFRAWYGALSALNDEELQIALTQLITTERFLPSPQDVVAVFKGTEKNAALLAWEKCCEAAKRFPFGANQTQIEEFYQAQDLTIQDRYAIRLTGGITAIARCDDSKLEWKKKEFVEAFQSFNPKALSQALPGSDLPQISVLAGQMSLNGKRPETL